MKTAVETREYRAKWKRDNRARCKEHRRKWRRNNKPSVNAANRRRRKSNPNRKRYHYAYNGKWARAYWAKHAAIKSDTWIAKNLRTRIYLAVKRNQRAGHLPELLGCSVPELRQYLESRFKPGMNWGNYGQWHIDHVKPCAVFDMSKPEEQRACFHYTNLQPLWWNENVAKGARI